MKRYFYTVSCWPGPLAGCSKDVDVEQYNPFSSATSLLLYGWLSIPASAQNLQNMYTYKQIGNKPESSW